MIIAGIIYLIGFIASAIYMFRWLDSKIGNKQFDGRDYGFEGFIIGFLSVFWPAFILFLIAVKFGEKDDLFIRSKDNEKN